MSLLVLIVAIVLFALAAGLSVALWLGSDQLLVPQGYRLLPEFTVLAYEAGKVTLPAPPSQAQFADTRREGTYGLLWQTGYGRLGPVLEDDGERLVRALTLEGGAPPRPGEPARLDNFVFRRDPWHDRGLSFEDVGVPSGVGELAAWWLPGEADLAVLVLHGRRRGERAETLRCLPAVVAGGRSALVLAYRNHRGSPPSPDGFYHYGLSEAEDALAGVAFLAAHGASRVVIYGFSMGAAAALEAVKRWPPSAPPLAGLVLDSPLVDPTAVATQRIRLVGLPLPRAWAWATLGVASWRSGLRWRALDQRRFAERIAVPMLLVAGVRDRTVPIAVVDEFASRMRAPLRYHRVEPADHIEAWNVDPEAYEGRVRAFLGDVAGRRVG